MKNLDRDIAIQLIDNYLLDKLSPDEKKQVQLMCANNSAFNRLFEQRKEVIQNLILHAEITSLQATLDSFHVELISHEDHTPKKTRLFRRKRRISTKQRILSTMGIAVAVSIVMFFTSLYIMRKKEFDIRNLESESYHELNNKLNSISDQNIELKSKLEMLEKEPIELNKGIRTIPVANNGLLVSSFWEGKQIDLVYQLHLDSVDYNVKMIYNDRDLDISVFRVEDTLFKHFVPIPYNLADDELLLGTEVYILSKTINDISYAKATVSQISTGTNSGVYLSESVESDLLGSSVFSNEGDLLGIVGKSNIGLMKISPIKNIKSVINNFSKEKKIKPHFPTHSSLSRFRRDEQIKRLQKYCCYITN